jgi:hypothetical protein
MASPFDAPIPGQSLTDEPGNAPWEKPAQYDTVDDAAKFYIQSFTDPDVMDDLSVMFENGMTLSAFTKTTIQMGGMNGMHTVDVGLLVQPILSKFLKAAMKTYGIDAKDEALSPDEKKSIKQKKRMQLAIKLAMADAEANGKSSTNDPGVSLMQAMQSATDAAPQEDMATAPEAAPMEQKQPAAPQGAGLMARGV